MERSPLTEQRVVEVAVQRMNGSAGAQDRDLLAVEEPLELRLGYGTAEERRSKSLTVTMRTPGSDIELAAGFLFAEGLVQHPGDIAIIQHCGPPAGPLRLRNVLRVELQSAVEVNSTRLERNFLSTSSCGICGKASLKALPSSMSRPIYPICSRSRRDGSSPDAIRALAANKASTGTYL